MRHMKREFALIQGNLKKLAFRRYTKVLASLLRLHSNYSWARSMDALLRSKNYAQLYALADSLSSLKYDDADEHFSANQFSLLIKKYPWPQSLIGLDPEANAISAFSAAEKRCSRVNRKFSFLALHPSRDVFALERDKAKKYIRSLIGKTLNYGSIFLNGDFGQGASLGIHGDNTHWLRKASEERWTCTPGSINAGFGVVLKNYHLLSRFLEKRRYDDGSEILCLDYDAAFNRYVSSLDIIDNNKISFVPKTAKTHRSIAVEPLVNGIVQKGIDVVMRRKLLYNGNIDLSDQSLNQRLAREGSLDDGEDSFVTIDLKSASDSISIELVRYLLPDGWFDALNRARASEYVLNDGVYTYNKFCSMGNGFCFPLETLIFAAACHACDCGEGGVDFSVYGDDIIIRKRYARRVLDVLRHWGFKANHDKTFLEGPFRESCGADFFRGQDVRPFTLDYALDSVQSLFKFLNLTRRNRRTSSFFEPVRYLIIKMIPEQYRFFRPLAGPVDTGIDAVDRDEYLYSPHVNYVNGAWVWKVLRHSPIVDSDSLIRCKDEQHLLVGVALRGTTSLTHGTVGLRRKRELVGVPGVTYRRKTVTEIARESYASTSNWLPPSRF